MKKLILFLLVFVPIVLTAQIDTTYQRLILEPVAEFVGESMPKLDSNDALSLSNEQYLYTELVNLKGEVADIQDTSSFVSQFIIVDTLVVGGGDTLTQISLINDTILQFTVNGKNFRAWNDYKYFDTTITNFQQVTELLVGNDVLTDIQVYNSDSLLLTAGGNNYRVYTRLGGGGLSANDSSWVQSEISDTLDAFESKTVTLANKTIDANNNTILNIGDSELTTGINTNKLANGSVSNTEFQYINSVTSDVQTQLNTKIEQVDNTTPVTSLTNEFNERVTSWDNTNSRLEYFNIGSDSIASSATPTFNMSNGYTQIMLVNQAVTSATISNLQDGQQYCIVLIQDATGYAITLGASFGTKTDNSADLSTGANKHNIVFVTKYGSYTRYTIETSD